MNHIDFQLNDAARLAAFELDDRVGRCRIPFETHADELVNGPTIIDCGIDAVGGIETGRRLAEICLGMLGKVSIAPANHAVWPGPAVQVETDHPAVACMASQYAGWKLEHGKFFAMGSGPMRAAAAKEAIFATLNYCEKSPVCAVGVLETRQRPPLELCEQIAHDCGVTLDELTLLLAPTASYAGSVQIVARSVETALHKMHELGFDILQVESAYGIAPLPPIAKNDLAAIGRTNDAILYGGEVTLWVNLEDDQLSELGPKIPSSASTDFGEPFAAVFERYNREFYAIDPQLFSPAVVTLNNRASGRTFRFGKLRPDVIERSFQS